MICLPCRTDEHKDCPELARQAKVARNGIIGLPMLDDLAVTSGSVCDCQHMPRRQ